MECFCIRMECFGDVRMGEGGEIGKKVVDLQ